MSAKEITRKSRDLDEDAHCVVTTDTGDLHVVVEGTSARLTERADLERASTAFEEIFDWPTTIVGDELDAPYGAPTSGGQPYRVYEIHPTKAFAFPTDGESSTPTRWRFL